MNELQRTPEWFARRQGKITASIAAACLGLDPYVSARKAWRTILGTEPDRDSHHKSWGREFEGEALSAYEIETGNLVRPVGFIVHPQHPWLGASPDGLILSDGMVEIKCPMQLPKSVPIQHRIQILVQLACTGRKWCDYFAWNNKWYTERVYPQGLGGLIRRLERFYLGYVLPKVEPPRKKPRKR